MMRYFLILLLLLPLNLFSEPKLNDFCEYRLLADGEFKGHLKMKLIKISPEKLTIDMEHVVGSLRNQKVVDIDRKKLKNDFFGTMLAITATYNKDQIKVIKKTQKPFTFQYRENHYPGERIIADVEIKGKKYRLIYVLSKEIPILNLLKFQILQDTIVNGKKTVADNAIFIKDFGQPGKLRKL